MTGFADLVPKAAPVLIGEHAFDITVTQGADFSLEFVGCDDDLGLPIDMTAAAITATGGLRFGMTGAEVAAWSYTGTLGGFTVSLDDAVLAALDAGSYVHWLRLADAEGHVIQAWGPSATTFIILPD